MFVVRKGRELIAGSSFHLYCFDPSIQLNDSPNLDRAGTEISQPASHSHIPRFNWREQPYEIQSSGE
jgi:hypothetical protein